MSVAQHLKIKLSEYDRRIRTFIPHYEEMLEAAASALQFLDKKNPAIVDLGIGTGALASRCLKVKPAGLVYGIDSDADILAMAKRRLAKVSRRSHEFAVGNFTEIALPKCEAVTASLALHHITTRTAKRKLYARCFAALRAGGVLINADCCPASDSKLAQRDMRHWQAHLERFYTKKQARAFFAAWAEEDTYFPLAEEMAMLRAAGFKTEVVWRRAPLAVVVGIKA
jgi:ubiquinone/menaquinone biosynthesis C-methylase UbiE